MKRPSQKEINEKYNQSAVQFNDNPVAQSLYFRDGVPVKEDLFDEWANYVQKYFKIEKDDILLDVGCGAGLFLKRFAKFTSNLYGIDPAENLVKSAQSYVPIAICKVGHALKIPFSKKFTKIFCNSVILYLNFNDCKKALKLFIQKSKPGSKIWIGDICYPNPQLCDKNFLRIEKSTGWKVQHYPPQFFIKILEKYSFKYKFLFQEVKKSSAAYRYDLLIEID